jgi:hypothetical protein
MTLGVLCCSGYVVVVLVPDRDNDARNSMKAGMGVSARALHSHYESAALTAELRAPAA